MLPPQVAAVLAAVGIEILQKSLLKNMIYKRE
eukprot:SAG22_NODE_8829_length_627_cov_1.049242_1_plen_31_part_10